MTGKPLPRRTCTDHCSEIGGCGRHFHGTGAFDLHRTDGSCLDPADVLVKGRPVLRAWATDGYCDKMAGCWSNGIRLHYNHPVTIWQVVPSAKQLEGLQRLRRGDSGQVGG